jgi:hypothetical protein
MPLILLMRTVFVAFAAMIVTALPGVVTPAAADAVTTRIETRPYYGAIVTVEQGVRVWRALPPHDRIIINPQGQTPVTIGVGGGNTTNLVNAPVRNTTTIVRDRGAIINGR